MRLRVRNNLWLISDTHFGHKNIVKFAQRPESHEVIMLSNWIDRVREEDQILHLGDVFMGKQGNPDRWAKVVGRLPGEKFLMLGNHDVLDERLYRMAGFEIVEPFTFEMNSGPLREIRVAVTHEPIGTKFSPGGFSLEKWDVNVHGHTHGSPMGANPRIDGHPIEGKGYVNICVEVTDLAPVQLGGLTTRIQKAMAVNVS